ncbi:MAG: hypothetical protein FJX44_02620 [Alphaproteobacteria bacterium]|nr:hypothetical protein [Alphaproteobacteria bacterium]
MAIFRRRRTEPGFESKRAITPASRALDPIDAAHTDIAGSKHLIASVSDDLTQHYRWIESNRSAEIKHKRRLKRQEVMYQLELHRRSLVRVIRLVSLLTFHFVQEAAQFLWEHAKAAFFYLRDLVARGVTWAAPYARALAKVIVIAFVWLVLELRALSLALGRGLATLWAWFQEKGGIAARKTGAAISTSSAWLAVRLRTFALQSQQQFTIWWATTKVHAERLARASAHAAVIAAAWSVTNGKALALDLGRWFSAAASWLGRTGAALLRATFGAIAAISMRVAMKSRKMSRAPKGPALLTDMRQRQTPEPSTALTAVEPLHAALPVVQTEPQDSDQASPRAKKPKKSKGRSAPRKRPISSHTGRASP